MARLNDTENNMKYEDTKVITERLEKRHKKIVKISLLSKDDLAEYICNLEEKIEKLQGEVNRLHSDNIFHNGVF